MIKKGIGMACGGHTTGLYAGGDTNQAKITLEMDGTFDLLMGTTEIGQGCMTAFLQVAAEALDVPIEAIVIRNTETDTVPICTGAFASRAMFVGGNAIIAACNDLKQKIIEFCARKFEVQPEQLTYSGNQVSVTGASDKTMTMADIGCAVQFGGEYLVGAGASMPELCEVDSETGAMPNVAAMAYTACVVEIEVDTNTGIIDVVKAFHAYEIGKAINPLICRGHINGGTAMGIGMALSEDAHPSYPLVDNAAASFAEYNIATAADMAKHNEFAILEVPHPDGPFGAKGFSECSMNVPIPAIIAAIHDATGVWISQFPATPEVVLKALEESQA